MSAIDSQRFTALGQEWTIRFDFNAICEIEEQTGTKFMVTAAPFLGLIGLGEMDSEAGLAAIAQRVDFANLRQLLFWALQGAHEDIEIRTAGEIVSAIGLPRAVEIIARALVKALPTGTEGDASGTENPPKPKRKAATRKSTRKGSAAAKAG